MARRGTFQDDEELLNEYVSWRDFTLEAGVDASVDAFMRMRSATDAFDRIGNALNALSMPGVEDMYAKIEQPTRFERKAIEVLRDVERALIGDREYTEDRSLTGPTRKVLI